MTEQELKENYSKEVYEAAITLSPEIQKNMDFPYIKPAYVDESRALSSKVFGQMGDENNKAQEAVLLRADTATRGISDTVLVLEKNTKGEYVEREYTVKFGGPCIENYPGNHVWIVKSKSGIGIYENGEKNKKYPRTKKYMAKIVCAKICDVIQSIIAVVGGMLSIAISFYWHELSIFGLFKFLLGIVTLIVYLFITKAGKMLYRTIFGKELTKDSYHNTGYLMFAFCLLLYIICMIVSLF